MEDEQEGLNIITKQSSGRIFYVSIDLLLLKMITDPFFCSNSFTSAFLLQSTLFIETEVLLFKTVKLGLLLNVVGRVNKKYFELLNLIVVNALENGLFPKTIKKFILELYNAIKCRYPNLEQTVEQLIFLLQETDPEEVELELMRMKGKKRCSNMKINTVDFVIDQTSTFDIIAWEKHVTRIAQELTSKTSDIYKNIRKTELINKNWTRQDKRTLAPNIVELTSQFDKLTRWIIEEVLAYDSEYYRAKAIEVFIAVAEECWQIGNFYDLFCIDNALTSACLLNLEKSWSVVSESYLKKRKKIKEVCSFKNNYANLRIEIASRNDEFCLPCMLLYLKELAILEEGPAYIRGEYLVNVNKIIEANNIIENFLQYQRFNYLYVPHKQLRFLSNLAPMEEAELVKLSMTIGRTLKRT